MPLYVCRVWKGEVRLRAAESLRWVFLVSCAGCRCLRPISR